MTTRSVTPRTAVLGGLILVVALSRLLPHPPNATPVLALALFGGAYFASTRWAYAVSLLAMVVSDLSLALTEGYEVFTTMRLVVYICIALTVALGLWGLGRVGLIRVAVTGLAGAVLFFVATNFLVWIGGTMYPHTFSGLVECYVAALPFFRNTLLSTWGYSVLLFGVFEGVKVQFPALALSRSEA